VDIDLRSRPNRSSESNSCYALGENNDAPQPQPVRYRSAAQQLLTKADVSCYGRVRESWKPGSSVDQAWNH
jgi:hypothetical protein